LDSVCVTINYNTYPAGIRDSFTGSAILSNAYPSPADREVNLNCLLPVPGESSIIIHDLSGSIVLKEKITKTPGTIRINTSALHSGTYFYSLISDGKTILSRKMVISH